MRYMLVETTGDFMLVDPNGQAIQSHRPSVVVSTGFVQSRMALDQIRWLGDLPERATDAEFEKTFKDADGDGLLATASFLNEYLPTADDLDQEEEKTSKAEPKQRRNTRKRVSGDAVSEG